jgi:hypothetical protein
MMACPHCAAAAGPSCTRGRSRPISSHEPQPFHIVYPKLQRVVLVRPREELLIS